MSGHSKWANIQHRKGAQDKKRGNYRFFCIIFTSMSYSMPVADFSSLSKTPLFLIAFCNREQNGLCFVGIEIQNTLRLAVIENIPDLAPAVHIRIGALHGFQRHLRKERQKLRNIIGDVPVGHVRQNHR